MGKSVMKVLLLIVIFCLTLIGCANTKNSAKAGESSNKVKQNAEIALEQCGKGNVKKVDTSGFICKKQ